MASAPDPEAPIDDGSRTSNSLSFPTVSESILGCSPRATPEAAPDVPLALRSVTHPGNLSIPDDAELDEDVPAWASSLPASFWQGRSTTEPSGSDMWFGGGRLGGSKDPPSAYSDLGRAKSFLERTHSSSLLWAAQLGRTVTVALNRHGVNLNPSSVVPMQRCNICLESVPSNVCVVPEACGRQAHSACTDCMSMYIKLRVEEGRVTELWCPCAGSDGCSAKVADGEVEAWMSEGVLGKYRRFMRMHRDSSLRACPDCNELCEPDRQNPEEADSPIIPEMTCHQCGCQFCYYHSNAHAVGSKACAEHEREVLKQERKALAKMNTRKCPKCGVVTEKVSGCNHMTCTCTCQWCWVCGQEITNVGWHYHPLKPFSCAQYNEKTAQSDHVRLMALMTFTKILTWPSAVVAALFLALCPFVFIAAVFAQVVPICCACCCCLFYCICIRDFDLEDCVKVILSIAMGVTFLAVGVPFLGFCLAWCFVALPLWFLLIPVGARSEHLMVLACAPLMTVLASMECFAPETE
mmetsp:Transcript_109478/g.290820  ORF Transcript_109478/g.290820 Transcript_109478/m.290820 type:complete len:522 (-) Transcript_109478:83-1648(-)